MPAGCASLRLPSRSRAVSIAPAATTTCPARIVRRSRAASTNVTPVTRPRPSVSIRSATHELISEHRPVASARGIIVLCVPFFASVGHAKPTHCPHCTQSARPPNGTELIRRGTGPVGQPSVAAPRAQHGAVAGEIERRHRIAAGSPTRIRVRVAVARDADLPFRAVVERREIVVADGPVGQRAAIGNAVARRHAEVVGEEPPSLRAVHARAASDGHRIRVPARLVRSVHDVLATAGFEDPRAAARSRRGCCRRAPRAGGCERDRSRRRGTAATRRAPPAGHARRPRRGRRPQRRRPRPTRSPPRRSARPPRADRSSSVPRARARRLGFRAPPAR